MIIATAIAAGLKEKLMTNLSDRQIAARLRPHYKKTKSLAAAVRACGWMTSAEYKFAYMAILRAGLGQEFGLASRPRRRKPAMEKSQ